MATLRRPIPFAMRLVLPLVGFALPVLAAYAPHPAAPASVAARPDSTEWENLQILPDSIPRDSLISIMREFSQSLGVRCNHCHAQGYDGLDFPSDANPHKDVARGMMRLTWQVNQEILPAIDGLHEADGVRVTCYTCHRGATHPETQVPDTERPAPPPEPSEHDHGDHDHGDR